MLVIQMKKNETVIITTKRGDKVKLRLSTNNKNATARVALIDDDKKDNVVSREKDKELLEAK